MAQPARARCNTHYASCPMSPSGVLNLNKPVGPTSHDLVAAVRRATGIKRVGHAGTLDPLASGVLLVCLGSATRISEYLLGHDKRYRATIRFGASTETLDAGSPVVPGRPVRFDCAGLEAMLPRFVGTIRQIPPAYSAVKVAGRAAYSRARAGEAVELAPRTVTIHSLTILEWKTPDLLLDVHCSSGTYIRALARDLGEALGTGAYLLGLLRTAVGSFRIEDSVDLAAVRTAVAESTWEKHLIPPAEALRDLPAVQLDESQIRLLTHGRAIPGPGASGPGLARGLDSAGGLIAILEADPTAAVWRPEKVFLHPE